MIITNLKKQIRNPDKVSVFFDGRFLLSVSYQDVIEYKLRVGLEISKEQLAQLKVSAAESKLKELSLKWLLSRPRSINEYQLYLKKKAISVEKVEALTKLFLEKRYLDQEKYARWLIQKRQKKGTSRKYLLQELQREGMEDSLIHPLLSEQYNDRDESDNLRNLINKKRHLSRYKNDDVKLIRYFVGKGFAYRDIKDALDISKQADIL